MPTSEVISFAQILLMPYDSIKRYKAPKVHHIHHNYNTVLYLYWVTLVLVCEENTCFMNEHMSLLRQCHNTQDTTTLMRMYCLVQCLPHNLTTESVVWASRKPSTQDFHFRSFIANLLEGKLLAGRQARGMEGVEARWCISYDITVEKFLHTTKLSRSLASLSLPTSCLLTVFSSPTSGMQKVLTSFGMYVAHNLKLFSLLDLRRAAALSAELLFSSLRGNVFWWAGDTHWRSSAGFEELLALISWVLLVSDSSWIMIPNPLEKCSWWQQNV